MKETIIIILLKVLGLGALIGCLISSTIYYLILKYEERKENDE